MTRRCSFCRAPLGEAPDYNEEYAVRLLVGYDAKRRQVWREVAACEDCCAKPQRAQRLGIALCVDCGRYVHEDHVECSSCGERVCERCGAEHHRECGVSEAERVGWSWRDHYSVVV